MILSYIIPMYNCAKYIAECLDSILSQGLDEDEYEVIIVNDGSTDNSAEIAGGYCREHSNFRLIDQYNQGVGMARNRGLAEATGQYIYFMDADDWLVPDSLHRILLAARRVSDTMPDIIAFGFQHVYQSRKCAETTVSDQYKYLGTLIQHANDREFITMCWKTMIRRNVAQKYRFRSFKMFEDTDYMFNLYLSERDLTIVEFDARIYCYRQRKDSAIHNIDRAFTLQTFESINHLYDKVNGKWHGTGLSAQRVSLYLNALSYMVVFRMLCSRYRYADCRSILHKYTQTGLLPFTRRASWVDTIFGAVSRSPMLMWLSSPLYSFVYLKYFKKNF